MRSARVEVTGMVQGVGFRPFVYRTALRHNLRGQVYNHPRGVEIFLCGQREDIDAFMYSLASEAPPAAVIESIKAGAAPGYKAGSFEIAPSSTRGTGTALVSPDLATCTDCLKELFDPSDRRYRYPFINCTRCGPRFTIIRELPYDRPVTSMGCFPMCPECSSEYHDPFNRRFHAQPNACSRCGPELKLLDRRGEQVPGDPLATAVRALLEGAVVAIKGLGGFHLACDATSHRAVATLRAGKHRAARPFAVMAGSLEQARQLCTTTPAEEELLASPGAPIVLLASREPSPLSGEVAPGLVQQGVMLPGTPVHHLLLADCGVPLVMTSGNLSNEPVARDNSEAVIRLGEVADLFLVHNRDILVRYDDSVAMVVSGRKTLIRRARGYAPFPIMLPSEVPVTVLALGAELRNTFCLATGTRAFLGQHTGDLEGPGDLDHYFEALESIMRLFSLRPEVVACDLHPDYLTTALAPGFGLATLGVQHHHAHVVSCQADNGHEGRVLGLAWDGTGYGEDGTIWGGEFLLCDGPGFTRVAHLSEYPMPGADACIHRPYRMAAGIVESLPGGLEAAMKRIPGLLGIDPDEIEAICSQVAGGFNTPLTTGAGRLFDAVAALTGTCRVSRYEGQAACELEAIARRDGKWYHFELERRSELPWVVNTGQVFAAILDDLAAGTDPGTISGRFHETMAAIAIQVALELAGQLGVAVVALSGGVFQNRFLLEKTRQGLEQGGLKVLTHRAVPAGDGGISLGQAVIAGKRYREGR